MAFDTMKRSEQFKRFSSVGVDLGGFFQSFFHRQVHLMILLHGNFIKNFGSRNEVLKSLFVAFGQIFVAGKVFRHQFNLAHFIVNDVIQLFFT